MSNFYIKSSDGTFIPVEVKELLSKDLNNKLVIFKIGSDEKPITENDLERTADSLSAADVLSGLDNCSIIITPYQIDVGIVPKDKLEDKHVYMQIQSGDNISLLEEQVKSLYSKFKKKFDLVILPTPLKFGEYKKVKEILKRSMIRKKRRGRARG